MPWTLNLDPITHDLRIVNGKIPRVTGSDEVRQRVKVALWHYLQEYFLNTPEGVPYIEQIWGRKEAAQEVSNILRNKVLRVPGVVNVVTFEVEFNSLLRAFEVNSQINVTPGPGEISRPLEFNTRITSNG